MEGDDVIREDALVEVLADVAGEDPPGVGLGPGDVDEVVQEEVRSFLADELRRHVEVVVVEHHDGVVDARELLEHEPHDGDGRVWIATERGATRYTPGTTSPKVRVDQVLADSLYEAPSRISVSDRQDLVRIEYTGASLTTPPNRMAYRYRLRGLEEEWQQQTGEKQVAYTDLPVGEYTFEAKAVDRDLNYSDPASVEVSVYHQPVSSTIGIASLSIDDLFASFYQSYQTGPSVR